MNTHNRSEKINSLAQILKNEVDSQILSLENWVNSSLRIASALLESKSYFSNDKELGYWLADNDCYINISDRDAYITLAQDVENPDILLRSSKSRSIRDIVNPGWRDKISDQSTTIHSDLSLGDNEQAIAGLDIITQTEDSAEELLLTPPIPCMPDNMSRQSAIYTLIGQREAAIIIGFFNNDTKCNGRTLRNLKEIATSKSGRTAVRRLANMLATGKYGAINDTTSPSEIGPRMIFPYLPKKWSEGFSSLRKTPESLTNLCDSLDDYAALNKALSGANPENPDMFCHQWWQQNIIKGRPERRRSGRGRPKKEQNSTPLVPMDQLLDGVELPISSPKSLYEHDKRQERYIPYKDNSDIVVCGATIYKSGSEKWETFCKVFAAYQFWRMLEGNMKRTGDDVVNRGFEYRRLAAYGDWGDPVFGQALWNIGNAMARYPDKLEETHGPKERGSFK
jgi:hypothetical protein